MKFLATAPCHGERPAVLTRNHHFECNLQRWQVTHALPSHARRVTAGVTSRRRLHLMGSVPGIDGHVLRCAHTNAMYASAWVSLTMSPGPSQSLPLNVWYSPSQWPVNEAPNIQLMVPQLKGACDVTASRYSQCLCCCRALERLLRRLHMLQLSWLIRTSAVKSAVKSSHQLRARQRCPD